MTSDTPEPEPDEIEKARRFSELVRNGAHVLCNPADLGRLRCEAEETTAVLGIEIRESEEIPPGEMIAIDMSRLFVPVWPVPARFKA